MNLVNRERKFMLLSFRIKNFKSFAGDAELSMIASSIKEHSSSLINANGIKILPIAAFFGANGCGKSNFMEAFAIMHDLILHYGKCEKKLMLKEFISPFIFDENSLKEPSEFEISVYDSKTKKEYRYGFAITKQKIVEEWLFMKTFSLTKNLKEKCIFYRNNKLVDSDILNEEKKEIDFVNSLTAEDELLITNLGKRRNSKYSFIYDWMNQYNHFIDYANDINEVLSSSNMQEIFEFLYNDKKALKEVSSLLNMIDESVLKVVIEKELDNKMNERFIPYSIHKNDKDEFLKLPFYSESCGTKKMLAFSVHLLSALEMGLTLFVDELDSKLHPLILRYIVGMFTNKDINTGGGQLIFTSHNLICLDANDLRRDEIWFVEKNNQRSALFSLYDFKETNVRNDLSFGKHYLNGRFGAVPFANEKE